MIVLAFLAEKLLGDRTAYLLGILIREKRITGEALARGLRVVTILATGQRTGAGS
ncbi:MAG: hypothetical protein ACXW27_08960 [Allosphingosinicella sp.]